MAMRRCDEYVSAVIYGMTMTDIWLSVSERVAWTRAYDGVESSVVHQIPSDLCMMSRAFVSV